MQYKNQLRGAQNKYAGKTFENMIVSACGYYSNQGIAEIEKTPEPMKPISSINGGKFIACYEKKAQPDFKGTLKGGKAIVLEAKCTRSERLMQSAVTPEQRDKLIKHTRLGAVCYILVCFNFTKYYCIPWKVFDDMKSIYGHKYITTHELGKNFEISVKQGVLRFLG